MLKGFRDFVLRGNVIDLAVAVVIGAAFGSVVTAIVEGLITPLIALITSGGSADVSALNVGGFGFGDILNAIINFIIVAAVVYFVVVLPMNRLQERNKPAPPDPQPTKTCPECLSEIPEAARRCAFCTSPIPVEGHH